MPDVRTQQPRRLAASLCALALLLAVLAYRNALPNPFVYDDHLVVVENESITKLGDLRAIVLHDIKRPLVNLSYAADYAVWGLAPFGYHITNLLLHLLNIGLLFAFARRAAEDHDVSSDRSIHDGRALAVAFTAAALLAVHPLMTQAVGYIAARADLLCATFLLAALLCYRAWVVTGRARWGVSALLSWLVAVGAKETAVMLPILAVIYDALILRAHGDGFKRRLLRVLLPLVVVMLAVGGLRLGLLVWVEYGHQGTLHWTHALVEADVLRQYTSLLVVPAGQSIFHPVAAITSMRDVRGIFALLWVAALGIIALRVAARDGLTALGIAWFVLLLVPPAVLVMFDLGEPMAEHRIYLASMGAFLAAGTVAGWLWSLARKGSVAWRFGLAAALAVLLLVFGALTVQRNRVWSDPVRLWTEATVSAPDIWVTHLMLGQELQFQGRCAEAVQAYEEAIRLRPQEPYAYLKSGICLATIGRLDEATAMFTHAKTMEPKSTRPIIGLGMVASLAGRHDEARRYFLEAVDLDPGDAGARDALARLQADMASAAAAKCASLPSAERADCLSRALPPQPR